MATSDRNHGTGIVESLVAGTNVTIDDSDPAHPIITASGGPEGGVQSVVAGTDIAIDNTDPENPIISYDGATPPSGGVTVLDIVTTPVAVTGTTAQVAIYAGAIAGNEFTAGDVLRLRCAFQGAGNGTSINVCFGTVGVDPTILATSALFGGAAAPDYVPFDLEIELTFESTTTAYMTALYFVGASQSGVSLQDASVTRLGTRVATPIDTTTAGFMSVLVSNGTNPTVVRLTSAILEKVALSA